jgi:tetratricopeptide (TPR) repeat protein
MKIKYLMIATFFSLVNSAYAQTAELKELENLSTKSLNDKEIKEYQILLNELKRKNLNVEERLLYNFYSGVRPFLDTSFLDEFNKGNYNPLRFIELNSETILEFAKGCVGLLEYEEKSATHNKTNEIEKLILNSKPLLQTVAATYFKENKYNEALIVIRSIEMLYSKKSIQSRLTDAEIVFYYASAKRTDNELELAEKCFYQAIKINPQYFDAYYELALLKIGTETDYFRQIAELDKGPFTKENSEAYEVLKTAINKNKIVLVSILEKALKLKPNDKSVKKVLLSLYDQLDMTAKYTALKNKT